MLLYKYKYVYILYSMYHILYTIYYYIVYDMVVRGGLVQGPKVPPIELI